jgi:hypothetical protein
MDAIRLDSLHLRYRLPEPVLGQRPRFDRLLREGLQALLEVALEAEGISPREEICVRELHVPFRLGPDVRDEATQLAFARALAVATKEALRRGVGAVRYVSRAEALVDLAERAPSGELERVWAWKQLGLWRPGAPPTPDAAVEEVLLALARHPSLAPHCLRALLLRRRLEALAMRGSPGAWRELALRMVLGYGVPSAVAARWLELAAPPRGASSSTPAARAAQRPAWLPLASGGPGAWGTVLRRTAPWPRRALALAALLHAEPQRLRTAGQEEGAAALVFLEGLGAASVEDPPGTVSTPGGRSPATPAAGRPRLTPEARGAASEAALEDTEAEGGARAGELTEGERPEGRPGTPSTGVRLPARSRQDAPALAGDLRVRGRSAWGGLLFLLHLVEEAGAPDALGAALPGRSLRWALHRLGAALCGARDGDAALLAFTGLPPDARSPMLEEPPATADEDAAVQEAARGVVRRLRQRLPDEESSDERLLLALCRRRAELVVDPGWFEVHLELDEVDPRVRKAGLDLDLGFLLWLGVVVRFVYA